MSNGKKKKRSTPQNQNDEYSYLIGARGYFTEDDPVQWGGAFLQGVELLYSNDTSTKCGDCTSKRMTDVVSFEKDEHIVGIDFGDHEDTEDEGGENSEDDVDSSEKGGGDNADLSRLVLFTSRWAGRAVSFYFTHKAHAGDGLAPYVGLNEDESPDMNRAGEEFICKRGMRVTGMIFEGGTITSMVQEKIPQGQNEKWWEKHVAYRPWENLKFELNPNASYKYLAGVRAYYTENHKYNDDGFVIGVEFIYSDGTSSKSGDCTGKRTVEVIPFQQDEHIIGVDFRDSYGGGMNHLTFYTSHPAGRKVEFWTAEFDACGSDDRSMWSDTCVYVGKVTGAGKKFTCKRGNRVIGITFEDGLITKMAQEKIPKGQDEQWWELRKEILTSDRKAHGFNKRQK